MAVLEAKINVYADQLSDRFVFVYLLISGTLVEGCSTRSCLAACTVCVWRVLFCLFACSRSFPVDVSFLCCGAGAFVGAGARTGTGPGACADNYRGCGCFVENSIQNARMHVERKHVRTYSEMEVCFLSPKDFLGVVWA